MISCDEIKRRGFGVMRDRMDGGEREGKEGLDNSYFPVCGGELRVEIHIGYFRESSSA